MQGERGKLRVLPKIAPATQVVSVGASAPAPLSLFFWATCSLMGSHQPTAICQQAIPNGLLAHPGDGGQATVAGHQGVIGNGLLAWQALATCQQAMPERSVSRFWRWPSIHRCKPPAGRFCPRVRARRERQCGRIRPERTKTPAAAFLMAGRYKLTGEAKKSLRRRFGAFLRRRGFDCCRLPAFAVSQFSIWRLPSPKILRAHIRESSCRQTGRQASLAAMPLKLARKRQNRFSDRCLVQHTCKRENVAGCDLDGLPSIGIM